MSCVACPSFKRLRTSSTVLATMKSISHVSEAFPALWLPCVLAGEQLPRQRLAEEPHGLPLEEKLARLTVLLRIAVDMAVSSAPSSTMRHIRRYFMERGEFDGEETAEDPFLDHPTSANRGSSK
mmetsp:Transcript_100901/g.301003  ORF Transcript_100901/g.301003 Transcript_100901/m.301003 type:complete len:124 (+) Transcript_100901:191-562(+)